MERKPWRRGRGLWPLLPCPSGARSASATAQSLSAPVAVLLSLAASPPAPADSHGPPLPRPLPLYLRCPGVCRPFRIFAAPRPPVAPPPLPPHSPSGSARAATLPGSREARGRAEPWGEAGGSPDARLTGSCACAPHPAAPCCCSGRGPAPRPALAPPLSRQAPLAPAALPLRPPGRCPHWPRPRPAEAPPPAPPLGARRAP